MAAKLSGLGVPAWVFISALVAALCYFSLGHYEHNDHMYAVAPVLAQHLRPYADFGFVQTPLSLLLYSFIDKIVGERQLWVSLRIFSLAMQLGIVALGIVLCHRHARRKLYASVLFVSLYLSLRQADIIGAEIGNYTLALVLSALALTALDVFRGRTWSPLVVGILAGLSLSAKLSYIYVVAAFAIVIFVWERSPESRYARLASYGLGVLIGIVPILYYLLPNFDLFIFENIHFHYLSNIYRGNAPFPGLSNLGMFSVGSALVPLLILFLGAAAIWGAALLVARLWPRVRALALAPTNMEKEILCVGTATLVGAVTPGVIFQQYYAPPAFFFFLFVAVYLERWFGVERLPSRLRDSVLYGVLATAMLSSVLRANALTTESIINQRNGAYALSAVARMRDRLSDIFAKIDHVHPGCHGDLVTAFGVPAIGAGAKFATIDSTGAFAMRLDDIFAQRAPTYRWMSDPLRYLTPRSLILSGFYVDRFIEPKSPFENTIDRYAASHGFETITLGSYIYRPAVLYIPTACHIAEARHA